jgi:poly(A) polymerase
MQQTLLTLSNNAYLQLVSAIAKKLQVSAYFVGGGLRDSMLGRTVKDFDFALSGAAEALPVQFAKTVGGSFFWLDRQRCQSRVVRNNADGIMVFDFAPLRGNKISDDLLLRDFTINALALSLGDGNESVIDPLQGATDIAQETIRSCSDATFDDDPQRLLRALRFAVTLGFVIEPETWRQLCKKVSLLQNVAPERIRDELFQILNAPEVGSSLAKLTEAGLLDEIFPACLLAESTGQICLCGSVSIEKRIENAAAAEQLAADRIFSKVALELHGYLSQEIQPQLSLFSLLKLAAFMGETAQAELLTAALAEKLRIGGKACRILGLLCEQTEQLFVMLGRNTTSRAKYRFFADREPAGMALLILGLARGHLSGKLAVDLADYYFLEFPAVGNDMLLTGKEIMAILGIGQGCQVGEAAARLKDAESAGLVNDKQEARAYLEKNLLTTN